MQQTEAVTRRGPVVVLALAALLLGACDGRTGDGDLVATARAQLAQGEAAAAAIQLKNHLDRQPQDPQARLLLGRALLDSGDAAGAEIELRRARDLGVVDDEVLPALARALLALHRPQALTGQFALTQLQTPQRQAEFKTLLASAWRMQGELGDAEAAVADALQSVPDHEPALLMQANLSASRGQHDQAMGQVNRLLLKSPANVQALILQGHLLDAHGQREEAQRSWRNALQQRPATLSAHAALIAMHLREQDLPAARAQWQALNTALPNNPQTRYYEAQLALAQGEAARARELVQALLKGRPNDAALHLLAGAVELHLGSTARAGGLLAKAAQLAPRAPEPRLMLAHVHLQSGQASKVAEALGPLLDGDAPSPYALSLAARAEMLGGDPRRAQAYYDRAARLKPDDAGLRTARAVARLAGGQPDAGLAELQTLAAADRGIDADLALVSARLQRGDRAGVAAALDALQRKAPDNPLPPFLRGRLALERGETAQARRGFEAALAKQATYYPAVAGLAGLDIGERRFDAARQRFEQWLARDPQDLRARLALAEVARRAGAPRGEITALLVAAVKADPENPAAHRLLADHHMAALDFRAALAAAQAGLAALPDDPELYAQLGRAQLAAGDSQQAARSFEKLTRLLPQSPEPWLQLADAQVALKDLASARAAVRRAVELAPASLPARRAAAAMAVQARQFDEAQAHARALASNHPKLAAGHVVAGEIELARGAWGEAAIAFRRALERQRDSDAARGLYTALQRGGQAREATKWADTWLAEQPRDVAFSLQAGDLALGAQDWVGAERHFRAVLGVQPRHTRALNNLAWLLVKQGKPGAVALAERAVQVEPANPALLDTLASAYAHERQLPKALETQRRALAMVPESVAFRLNLAKLQMAAGDKAGARSELKALLERQQAFAARGEAEALLKSLGG